MTPIQSLHMALGELAYCIAFADGKIQREEREKLHSIVLAEIRMKDYDFDVSEIIFEVLSRDTTDVETAYKFAMNTIHVNSHYLSPLLKNTFCIVMEKVAKAYPPVTPQERDLISRFRKDIAPIVGDPVYYGK